MDPDVSTWNILIVDDDPDSLGVAHQFLTFLGAKVTIAPDGAKALEILAALAPTFILLDLSMPELDGWEVFKQVRANPATASIPVIALTAHAMKEDAERVKAAGFDGYITKPYILTSLLDDIKRVLAEAASRPAPPPPETPKSSNGAGHSHSELTHESR